MLTDRQQLRTYECDGLTHCMRTWRTSNVRGS